MYDFKYEVVAVSYELKKRVVIATDLTDDESDRVRRNYINKNGSTCYIGGRKVPVQVNIYRLKRPKTFKGDKEGRENDT